MNQIIKVKDVSKKFQLFWEDIIIFDKVNFEIDRNELVAEVEKQLYLI